MICNLWVMTEVPLPSSLPSPSFSHVMGLARASYDNMNSCGVSTCPVSSMKRKESKVCPQSSMFSGNF